VSHISSHLICVDSRTVAPTQAQIRLELTENLPAGGLEGTLAWLCCGINLENDQ
jgi:hypothetical protein